MVNLFLYVNKSWFIYFNFIEKNKIRVWEIYYYFRRVFIVIFVYFDVYDFSENIKENFLDDGWDGVVFLVFVVDVESEDGYICG